jgi:hypothetical protein
MTWLGGLRHSCTSATLLLAVCNLVIVPIARPMLILLAGINHPALQYFILRASAVDLATAKLGDQIFVCESTKLL